MNPVERAVRRIDAAQQRHRATAFVFGVIKKYGDDNGGVLAANLAQSAFVTVFPLLLILVTVLVKVASGAASLRHEVVKAVAKQFPFVGDKLTGNIHALNRSSVASLIVGLWCWSGGRRAWRKPACSRWTRCGTCLGRPGPVTCREWAAAMLFLGVLGSV